MFEIELKAKLTDRKTVEEKISAFATFIGLPKKAMCIGHKTV